MKTDKDACNMYNNVFKIIQMLTKRWQTSSTHTSNLDTPTSNVHLSEMCVQSGFK